MNKDESSEGKNRVSLEEQLLDQKSLRAVTGKTADWNEIAKDCIAFANATGGRLLLVNALVHRPYTQRGDIFLNLHPDRLEMVNPGPLPLGVTPQNVLHTTVRRNEHLARLFHDLKLMEREGSGFDKIFEVLLSQGRPTPELNCPGF